MDSSGETERDRLTAKIYIQAGAEIEGSAA